MSFETPAAKLHLPVRYFVWCSFAFGVLLAMLASRVVRYGVPSLPWPLDDLLGLALSLEALLFFAVWLVASFFARLLLVPLAIALYALRKRVFASVDGVRGTGPLLHSLLWTGVVLGHAAFDMHPLLARLCWVSLPFLHPRPRAFLQRSRLARLLFRLLLVVVFLYVLFADHFTAAFAVGLFWASLWWLASRGERRLLGRDRLLMAVVLVALTQLLGALGPLWLPGHGGRVLIDQMAYSFCEIDDRDRLYAALTNCPTLPDVFSGREACRDGVVAEFQLSSLDLVATHSFFSESFHGRLEQLLCLEDTIQIGLNGVVIDGEESRDTVIEFEADHPESFRAHIVGTHMGHRLAYDKKRDRVIYVPEWGTGIARYDRATGEARRLHLQREFGLERLLVRSESYELAPTGVHTGRDSLFLAEWIAGRAVLELDLETLEVVKRYALNDGGSVGVTVDEAYDRIYVAGLWGFSAWDLSTGRILRRSRLGLLNRYPVISETSGLIYVPSTVAGRIYVFDRETLVPMGVIPIGFGVRLAHVSEKTERLCASSSQKAFCWTTEELTEAFRGPSEPGPGR